MVRNNISELLGIGLYTIPQAARLSGVPRASIVRWMFGYRYDYKNETRRQPAVVSSELSDVAASSKVISFRDLIELKFVHAFREHGVSWKVIRHTAAKARELVQNDHPFSSQRFLTDGRTIVADVATSHKERALIDLASDQMLFRSVMLPVLRQALEFQDDNVVRWWPLGKRRPVVVDPDRQFGQPITMEEGVPTLVLAKAYESLGSMDRVARWYDVNKRSVKASIDFERQAA